MVFTKCAPEGRLGWRQLEIGSRLQVPGCRFAESISRSVLIRLKKPDPDSDLPGSFSKIEQLPWSAQALLAPSWQILQQIAAPRNPADCGVIEEDAP